jgi:hypothetical protein
MAVVDEIEEPRKSEQRRVSRRTVLKGAGIGAGVAWVAPVIVGSTLSPASALSTPCGPLYNCTLTYAHCGNNPACVCSPDAETGAPVCWSHFQCFPFASKVCATHADCQAQYGALAKCIVIDPINFCTQFKCAAGLSHVCADAFAC